MNTATATVPEATTPRLRRQPVALHMIFPQPLTEEERRGIESPNRHVSLPSPARARVEATLRDLLGELALLGVLSVGIFGSVARGEDTPASDVDLAILFAGYECMARIRVIRLLEVHFNRHVDVIRLPFHFPLDTTAPDDLIMVW